MRFKKTFISIAIVGVVFAACFTSLFNSNKSSDQVSVFATNETNGVSDYFKDIEANISSYTREGLYTALKTKINDGWKKISYNSLGSYLTKVDWEDGDPYLNDIYSDKHCLKTTDTGNYHTEGDTWNKEHFIPKSWWGGNEGGPNGEGGDMFNMYATDGWVNGMRSNYPLGETSKPTKTSNNGFSKLGNSSFSGYSGIVFEINDKYKPLAAHSYFYFACKYNVKYSSTSYTSGNGNIVFNKSGTFGLTDYATNLFLKWNKDTSYLAEEKARAERVYAQQNNLNPFIYHPEWADFIWGNVPITSDPYIEMGDSYDVYTGNTVPLNASIKYGTGTITYYSSDPDIATVDSNGVVTGVSEGNATVTASAYVGGNNITASAIINVVQKKDVSNVTLTGPTSITSGTKGSAYVMLTSTVHYSDGTTSNNVKYTSSNENVAIPQSDGKIIFYDNGTVDITATSLEDESKSTTLSITASNLTDPTYTEYVKVTNASDINYGQYLFVNESNSCMLDGSYNDISVSPNKVDIERDGNKIVSNEQVDGSSFTFDPSTGMIKSNAGYYIGIHESSNTINFSTTPDDNLKNTITINSDGTAVVKGSNNRTLRYNNSAKCFRYYASGQDDIYLYKKSTNGDTAKDLADYIMAEDTEGQCVTKYDTAKAKYLDLSSEQKQIFRTSEDETIVAARERYEAWARHQNDDSPYDKDYAYKNNATTNDISYTFVAIFITLSIGFITAIGLIIAKASKRKRR